MLRLNVPLILASASPRRAELLKRLGIPFEVRASAIEEVWPEGLSISDAVEDLARQKADAISAQTPDRLTLAGDTVVVLDDVVLGKPETEDEAAEMLSSLSGRSHHVYSGIALSHPATNRVITAHEVTKVTFAALSEDEISRYVSTGSPMDKAGAYGIQDDHGALFITGVEGDYYNVVGLPLHQLYVTLTRHFSDLLD